MRRPDFSEWLVHLTREIDEGNGPFESLLLSPRPKRYVAPFDVLRKILTEATIAGGLGFVKGKRRVACFSEIPLASITHFATKPDEKLARYRYYGVAVTKQAAYSQGGRPVIYLPDSESDWVPEDQKWRLVRFEPHNRIDYTREREWRVPDSFDLRLAGQIYVLVWSVEEAIDVRDVETSLQGQIAGVLPLQHITELM